MSEPNVYWHYFDEAWKQVIERFFPGFLHFFIPDLYEDVDFSRRFEFLDKEMEQLSQRSQKGAKYVDKLVKVFLKDGSEEWILVHIEVEADAKEGFSQRMFRYFYRIFDRYGRQVVSIALLTGEASETVDGKYERTVYGSGVDFRYLVSRLMDYQREELEKDDNPFALVVFASQERERLRRDVDGFDAKWYLIRKLYERGYSREEVVGLFEFIDWVIQLNDEEEDKRFWEEVKTLEEVRKMPYVTTGERIGLRKGREEGLQQGLQQMVIDALEVRFEEIPSLISESIHQTKDPERLKALHRQAIRSASLEEFQQGLNGNLTD